MLKDSAAAPAELLRQFLDTIPYAVAVVDTQMRYVAYSQRWLSAYHLPERDITGQSHYDIFPEIGEEWRAIHRRCLAGEELSRNNEPFPRQDGSIDYVSWQLKPWRNESGKIVGIFMYTSVSTQQVIAEQRNEEYEREIEILLDSTRAVPWRMDVLSGRFTYMSPHIESLLGYPVNSWCDMEVWAERIHPEDRGWAVSMCKDQTSKGLDHDFEYRAIAASGEAIWLRDTVTISLDTDGKPKSLAGIFIDINEQKRHELAVRQREEQYRSVIETSGDGFWLANMDGYLLETNDAYARLSGYSRNELNGMHISELEAAESPEETVEHINKIIEEGYDIFETRHRKKNGEVWDVEISTSYSPDHGGRFYVFCRDITERKRTQQELRLIAEVFRNTGEGIVITDTQGTIIDVNPAYCEITGYSRKEMIGEKPSKIRSDRHDEEFYKNMWRCLTEEGYWVGEIWDRRRNGEVFPKWLTINAVRDEAGNLTHYVGTFSDISVLKGIEKELEHMAYYDPLTGLPNRILFKDRLDNELNNCKRLGHRCAVLFLDLDRFKLINDTLGHTVGDDLLIEVSRRIKQSVRSNDTVARLGGDEFTLLLPQIRNTDAAAIVAQSIIDILSQPVTLSGEELRPGASIGIAIYPDDGESFNALTRHADAAMYEAKSSGRGQYRFFSNDMDETAHNYLSLERDLHRALENEEFFLVFQPQIDARTGKTIHCEALIRWEQPQRGIVGPDKFIPIAEDTGLIHAIGEWVIDEVCRNIAAWQREGVEVPTVAINLSARQFSQENLIERILGLLDKHNIGIDAVELEITESVAMENAASTMQRLTRLNEHGFSIAIDDFGTGYSSLSYLKRFPVNKLKLDRSFVMDIQSDANDAAISAAVISMARSLELDVVAEGVETAGQRDFLLEQGCHLMQGYFYSKPLDSSAFLEHLKTN